MTIGITRVVAGVLLIASATACSRSRDSARVLSSDMPLHLEDHLDGATITGSDLPAVAPATVEWRFDQEQMAWTAAPLWNPPYGTPKLVRTADALRITLTERGRVQQPPGALRGVIRVNVPDWSRADWSDLVIRARVDATSSVNTIRLGFNAREGRGTGTPVQPPFEFSGALTPTVRDGTIQTYRLRVDTGASQFRGPWRQLMLAFGSDREPGSIDLLSVSVVPRDAVYAGERLGVRSISAGGVNRQALFTHAPGRIEYWLRVPNSGWLQTALGVSSASAPVDFSVHVTPATGESQSIFRETYAEVRRWADRSIDLSAFAGQTIRLALVTAATAPGAVAFWGSPTVSASPRTAHPNVILYIIDGGGADYMSVYGYNRRTTPTLERLAAEGAVFEQVYSTASWTKPSTTSFMTSLHSSVLGNLTDRFDPLPVEARTMAQHFHQAGYQTGVFTSNPWAATASSLERGVDLLRDSDVENDSISSVALHQAFWTWRDANRDQPYWVHLQTTDVHEEYNPVPPFAGMFLSPQQHTVARESRRRLRAEAGSRGIYSDAFAKTGISRIEFFTHQQALYDESMAHNDYQLGRLVERLKASGEWSRTLLVVAADHSIESAIDDMSLALLDPLPPQWNSVSAAGPMFRHSISRVPLIVVWPGRIAGGQRFGDPVSLIDLLPTVLDLAGVEAADVQQGRSLAPLLRGQAQSIARPVILDEFQIDRRTGALQGRLEVVDGRWGASMWIGPARDPKQARPWPVLLYDIWNDSRCLQPANEQRPDLVKQYTTFLQDAWKDHQALAKQFKPGPKTAMTPEQLERLRALGYIR